MLNGVASPSPCARAGSPWAPPGRTRLRWCSGSWPEPEGAALPELEAERAGPGQGRSSVAFPARLVPEVRAAEDQVVALAITLIGIEVLFGVEVLLAPQRKSQLPTGRLASEFGMPPRPRW